MGRDLGWTALICRALLLGALLVVALAMPVSAVDPTPVPAPTPSVSPPSQQQIDDARDALDRMRDQGTQPAAPLTEVAGPTADADRSGSVASRISDKAWWTIGAGVLVLLVASETTRLGVRRAKHRSKA